MNGLRKKGGDVGDKSKQLIKQWKKLIPTDKQDSSHHHKTPPTSAPPTVNLKASGAKIPQLRDVDAFSSPSEPVVKTSKKSSREHPSEVPHIKVSKTTPIDTPYNGRESFCSGSLKTYASPSSRSLAAKPIDVSRSPEYRHGYVTSSGQTSHDFGHGSHDLSVSPGDRKRKGKLLYMYMHIIIYVSTA